MKEKVSQIELSPAGFADVENQSSSKSLFGQIHVRGLKRKSVRGGMVVLVAQVSKFVLQTGSVVILARLLSPVDFGLQGMVVVITGILATFRDIGLSAATVQRDVITHEQTSTLFWINVAVGCVLTALAAASAPMLVAFYHEPRLFWVTIVSGTAFMFNGLGAQHGALLQRSMRYATLAKIDILSLVLSSVVGVIMAVLSYGYWALVGMAVSAPIISAVGSWIAVPWVPGSPRRGCEIRSMLHFGGTVTCNILVVYLGYNSEKVLLGRAWGAEALGLYGRAFQLLNLPLQQLHSSMYTVAFPMLSRIQDNAERLCHSFLRGYSILLSLTIPITLASALFADEIVLVVLGRKWIEAAPVLRMLTPTILVFAMINPFGWFLFATGRAKRSLNMALLIAPTVILGIWFGMRYGPMGVAFGYSAAMTILLVPVIAWAIHGTGITGKAFWKTARTPLLSGLVAIVCGLVFKILCGDVFSPVSRLVLGSGFVFAAYVAMLLIVMGQKEMYLDLLNQIIQRTGREPDEV